MLRFAKCHCINNNRLNIYVLCIYLVSHLSIAPENKVATETCIPFASDYAVHIKNTHAYTNYVHDGLLSRGNNSVYLHRLLKIKDHFFLRTEYI